jgi:hypothetical protein
MKKLALFTRQSLTIAGPKNPGRWSAWCRPHRYSSTRRSKSAQTKRNGRGDSKNGGIAFLLSRGRDDSKSNGVAFVLGYT